MPSTAGGFENGGTEFWKSYKVGGCLSRIRISGAGAEFRVVYFSLGQAGLHDGWIRADTDGGGAFSAGGLRAALRADGAEPGDSIGRAFALRASFARGLEGTRRRTQHRANDRATVCQRRGTAGTGTESVGRKAENRQTDQTIDSELAAGLFARVIARRSKGCCG